MVRKFLANNSAVNRGECHNNDMRKKHQIARSFCNISALSSPSNSASKSETWKDLGH